MECKYSSASEELGCEAASMDAKRGSAGWYEAGGGMAPSCGQKRSSAMWGKSTVNLRSANHGIVPGIRSVRACSAMRLLGLDKSTTNSSMRDELTYIVLYSGGAQISNHARHARPNP